jgi:hypothetical protein
VATILLTWNTDKWDTEEYDDWVKRTRAGESIDDAWSVARRRNGVGPGDRAFLFRQGKSGRGLIGAGEILSEPYEADHWSGDGSFTNYVEVRWSDFLPRDEVISVGELESDAPNFGWRKIYASGRTVLEPTASRLEELWKARAGR